MRAASLGAEQAALVGAADRLGPALVIKPKGVLCIDIIQGTGINPMLCFVPPVAYA